MCASEPLRPYGLRENNFNQISPTETKAIAVKSDGTKPNVLTTTDGAMFVGFLGFSFDSKFFV
jgi:hypothetical protein